MNFSLNRSFVLILSIPYISHCPVSKVIRKILSSIIIYHPNCFTSDT